MVAQEESKTPPASAVNARVEIVQAPTTAPSVPASSFLRGAAVSLASAVLLWMCFFPLSWGWMSWVALVPFLSLVRSRLSGKQLFTCSYLCGSVFFWVTLQWMRVADFRMYFTWAMLAVYCAFYFPAALGLMRWLDRKTSLPFCLNAAIVWVGLEYIRSFLLTGFAWYYMGHALHPYLSLIQIADLGGVYAVSFVVVFVNAWIFLALYQVLPVREFFQWSETPSRSPWSFILQGTVAGGLVLGTISYGVWRLETESFTPGPSVALLQPNLDIRLRNQADGGDERKQKDAQRTTENHMWELCRLAHSYHPQLVIWPETSYFIHWSDTHPDLALSDQSKEWKAFQVFNRNQFGYDALAHSPTPHLFGVGYFYLDQNNKMSRYNSAVLMDTKREILGRYDKMHRVPFGEYVPLKDWIPFMNWLAPYDYDYSIKPGDRFTRFTLGEFRFGMLICFEDTDPFLARRYVVPEPDGQPVHFLVNISNDGWFDGTSEHDQHLAISRFRAIESRRSLVRSVNMGISAVIDGSGRVLKPTDQRTLMPALNPEWEVPKEIARTWQVMVQHEDGRPAELPTSDWAPFKKTNGVLLATVPIDQRASLYAWAGDWLPLSCWSLFAMMVGWSWLSSRRRSRKSLP